MESMFAAHPIEAYAFLLLSVFLAGFAWSAGCWLWA